MKELKKRNQKICERCLETLNFHKVAKEFNLSPQRIHEIWNQYNNLNPMQTLINKHNKNARNTK